jgi:hypothetical protein
MHACSVKFKKLNKCQKSVLFSGQKQWQNKTFGDDQFKFKLIVCKIVRELKVSTKRALIPDEFVCLLSENAIANIIPFCTYKYLSDTLPELGLLGDYAKSCCMGVMIPPARRFINYWLSEYNSHCTYFIIKCSKTVFFLKARAKLPTKLQITLWHMGGGGSWRPLDSRLNATIVEKKIRLSE